MSLPDLQELLSKLYETPSNENLVAVLSHPDCEAKLSDGTTLPPDHVRDYCAKEPQRLMGYLRERFLNEDGTGFSNMIISDKAHPDYHRQIIPFNAGGVMDTEDHYIVPVTDIEVSPDDGKTKDGITSGMDYLKKYPVNGLEEPKKPTFGSYIKEAFSFITGGSKTLREYRSYQSRVYDHLKTMGFEAKRPENYVRAPKKQTIDRTRDFGKYCMDDMRKTAGAETSGVRDRIRIKQNTKLMERLDKLPESEGLTEQYLNFTGAIIEGMRSEKMTDRTRTFLTEIGDEKFQSLSKAFISKGLKKDEIMDMLNDATAPKADKFSNGRAMSTILAKLNDVEALEI